MARPLRIEFPGALYHLTSRGNCRAPIFLDDSDRHIFLRSVKEMNTRFRTICHAYCLMTNHYHLVLETPEGNLARAIHLLNGVYTQTFNHAHSRVGHVFQGRYYSVLIQRESHLLQACRYIVMNPVKAGLCPHPADWRWSSYRGTAGLDGPHECLTTSWILSQFASGAENAAKAYSAFVLEKTAKSIWEDMVGSIALGSEEFAARCLALAKASTIPEEIDRKQRYADRPELSSIMESRAETIRKALTAVDTYGYRQAEVAKLLGLHYGHLSRLLKAERLKVNGVRSCILTKC